ncbi:hypothetical protein IKF92_02005 [Candidatus Saccharibacteria bacterium]|nr:hypothetical protein [Candidatus Saccharibacteria bacterium]
MIKLFCGEDRIKAKKAIADFLGSNYEVIEGGELVPTDLPSLFLGQSLFEKTRQILIQDLSANKPVFDELPKYLDTPHKVAILELKLDKRSSTYKSLQGKVEIRDFPLPKDPNLNLVFGIYRTAKTDGKKAVAMLEKIKSEEDPIMFFGLLASQAIKDFSLRQGIKEKRALKELSDLDIKLKTTSFQPWLLIESFLLRLSSLQ